MLNIRKKRHYACCPTKPLPIYRINGESDKNLFNFIIREDHFCFCNGSKEYSAPLGSAVRITKTEKFGTFISIISEQSLKKNYREADGKFYELPPLYTAEILGNELPEFAKGGNIHFNGEKWVIQPFCGTPKEIQPNTGILYLIETKNETPVVDFLPFEESNKYWACNNDGSTISSLENFLALTKK